MTRRYQRSVQYERRCGMTQLKALYREVQHSSGFPLFDLGGFFAASRWFALWSLNKRPLRGDLVPSKRCFFCGGGGMWARAAWNFADFRKLFSDFVIISVLWRRSEIYSCLKNPPKPSSAGWNCWRACWKNPRNWAEKHCSTGGGWGAGL